MLGGTGNLNKVFAHYPQARKTPYYDIYYVASIGYHLEALATHYF